MNKKFFVLGMSVLVYSNIIAQGQPNDSTDIYNLDEVVVSDSRFNLKRENSGKTVIKITAEELERNQGKSVAGIINSKSGLEINGSRGSEGNVLGVYARGGRGRQVLILIDGVRVSDPSSSASEYDLRLLNTAAIESIEIIKGAASTLYGSNAASAVINITTKRASGEKISGNFQASVGTDQDRENQNYNISSFSNSAMVGGQLGDFSYSVDFSNRYSDGMSALVTPGNEKDPFSNYSTNIRLGYKFSDTFKVSVFGNHTKNKADYDESFGLMDAPYQWIGEQKRLGLASEFKYNMGSVILNATYGDYASEDISSFPAIFNSNSYIVNLYNKYNLNDRFYSIVGLDLDREETEFEENKDVTLIDPYINLVYVMPFGMNINAGGRLNNHSEYGSHFVYNINPSYAFKTNTGYIKVLGSYATSYITPSLSQLFGFYGANPDLKPEDDKTIEGGLEYSVSHKLRFSALYFNRKEENMVIYGADGYENNEGTINADGVELELYWIPLTRLNLNANYTFTERKGDNAIRIPEHKVNAYLSYDFSRRTTASINYSFTGERTDTDFSVYPNVDLPLSAFSLVDFYISHEILQDKLKLFLNASNLFNENYTEIIGYTTKGRNFRIGIDLSL